MRPLQDGDVVSISTDTTPEPTQRTSRSRELSQALHRSRDDSPSPDHRHHRFDFYQEADLDEMRPLQINVQRRLPDIPYDVYVPVRRRAQTAAERQRKRRANMSQNTKWRINQQSAEQMRNLRALRAQTDEFFRERRAQAAQAARDRIQGLSQNSFAAHRQTATERERDYRANMSPNRKLRVKAQAAERMRNLRAQRAEVDRFFRERRAQEERDRHQSLSPNRSAERRRQNRSHMRSQRSQETPQRTQDRQSQDRRQHRDHRSHETPEQSQDRRSQDRGQHRDRRSQFTPEERTQETQQNTQQRRSQRANLSPDAIERRREQSRNRYQQQRVNRQIALTALYDRFMLPNLNLERDDQPRFDLNLVPLFTLGAFSEKCVYCRAFHFESERAQNGFFTSCCRQGKLRLPSTGPYPRWYKDAFTDPQSIEYVWMHGNERNLNAAVSFVTVGANITPPAGYGDYIFRVNGTIHHRMRSLVVPNDHSRTYAQLYFMDSATQANQIREQRNPDIDRRLIQNMMQFIRDNNPYAEILHSAQDEMDRREALGENTANLMLEFNREYYQPGIHPGRQNAVADGVNEVAAVFAMDNDGVPHEDRDFAIYLRPDGPDNTLRSSVNIQPRSPHLQPLAYALLFPRGNPGWHSTWRCLPYTASEEEQLLFENGELDLEIYRHISMQQYAAAQLHYRQHEFSPILHAGNLTQQFIVDRYTQIEAYNLHWIRNNQDTLKSTAYHTLHERLARMAEQRGAAPAPVIILPSTFTGSGRNMVQLTHDAFTIFQNIGKPDLFITFTCNSQWDEIQQNLLPGEKASDRPDLVDRVFKQKLNAMLDEISDGVLGTCLGYVYTIEYQKRGMPHAHILVTLHPDFKPVDGPSIDRLISAELPDEALNKELYDLVNKFMRHGPCRVGLCLNDEGVCSKGFPKNNRTVTTLQANSYPFYRRRFINNSHKTNRYVVPHNAYFLKKYKSHICVEVLTNMKSAIKYIYKYIFKGFDVASLRVSHDGRLMYNEVDNYLSSRYVSAPEGTWRIFEFRTHGRSHSVVRLPVHGPDPTEIVFDEGMEVVPEREDEINWTMLIAFFELNKDPNSLSRDLTYDKLPPFFLFVSAQRRWQLRQRQIGRTFGRLRYVSPTNVELFAIRTLLMSRLAVTSFLSLRTINLQVYPTFREAAQALGLATDDDAFFRAFDNLLIVNKPQQLRNLLATLLLTYTIVGAVRFWEKYRLNMIGDIARYDIYRSYSNDDLCNVVLHLLNIRFNITGRTNQTFGLPMPVGEPPVIRTRDRITRGPVQLNVAQQAGHDRIMAAVRGEHQQRCFLIIGPGGSGKTTLYKHIMVTCEEGNFKAKAFATTGIAATLMPGGVTVHRGFGLPIKIDDQSRSYLESRLTSNTCKELRDTHVLFIDEITMMLKHSVRMIDQLLKTIMGNNQPFGGKIMVFGGDFRQLLPVVQGGTRSKIIDECVISSPLWNNFEVITLTVNMRSGNQEFSDWLLNLGTGLLPDIAGLTPNMVEIPQNLLLKIPAHIAALAQPPPTQMSRELRAMIETVFSDDITQLSPIQLGQRAILCTTVKEMMSVNNHIITSIAGQSHDFFSTDDVVSDDPNDITNFPVEYLNVQHPSGMPPHKLTLKPDSIVMLLRNLDPENGLSNGTRLMVNQLLENAIVATIISDSHQGEEVFITRMEMISEERLLPIKLRRIQFPLIPAYAMTVNKSQGQTIERVGIFLTTPVFSHGALYVALSRSRDPTNVIVYIRDQTTRQGKLLKHLPDQAHRVFTLNVIFREVFRHQETHQPIVNLEVLDPELAELLQVEIQEDENDAYILAVQLPGEEEQFFPDDNNENRDIVGDEEVDYIVDYADGQDYIDYGAHLTNHNVDNAVTDNHRHLNYDYDSDDDDNNDERVQSFGEIQDFEEHHHQRRDDVQPESSTRDRLRLFTDEDINEYHRRNVALQSTDQPTTSAAAAASDLFRQPPSAAAPTPFNLINLQAIKRQRAAAIVALEEYRRTEAYELRERTEVPHSPSPQEEQPTSGPITSFEEDVDDEEDMDYFIKDSDVDTDSDTDSDDGRQTRRYQPRYNLH